VVLNREREKERERLFSH